MNRRIEINAGDRFGRLTATGRDIHDKAGRLLRECVCDCGNVVYLPAANLKAGNSKSCGCLRKEEMSEIARKSWLERHKRLEEKREPTPRPVVTPEWIERQVIRNQRAGLRFDDLWMFGEVKEVKRLRRMFY